LLHDKPDHIKNANVNLNKYSECRMNDREDEEENLVNKNQKLRKPLEQLKIQDRRIFKYV
jgi:hypothetical protein